MARRERHQHAPRRAARRSLGGPGRERGGRPVLLDHHMGVGAAEAERADGRPARRVALGRPVSPVGVHVERRGIEIEMAVRRGVVQGGHQLAMREAQQHLLQARHAGRGRGMADVALHRAQRAEAAPVGVVAEGRRQRGQLDRIAEPGTGAMRLDVADAAGVDRVAPVDLAQQLGLAAAARRGDAVGATVLVQARADDHAEDRVAVALGVGQPLEHQRAHALAGHEAVGGVVEGLAASLGREHAGRAHRDVRLGRQVDRHAAHQREVDLAVAQCLAGQVGRDECRRAGGVDRDRRPFQVQVVGQARRADRVAAADARGRAPVAHRELAVFVVHHAEIDAAALARQGARRAAHPLDRPVSLLQEQAVLRVHLLGLGRRNTEEIRIEAIDVVQQADPLAIDLALAARLRIVERLGRPAARRHLGDRVVTGRELVPERVEIGCAGVAPRHADDRDALGHRRGWRGRGRGRGRAGGDGRGLDGRGDGRRDGRCGGSDGGFDHGRRDGGRRVPRRRIRVELRLDEPRDAGDVRMVIHIHRLQRHAVALVDALDPLDADDRIHADLHERALGIDLGQLDEQRIGEAAREFAHDPLETRRIARRACRVGHGLDGGRGRQFGHRPGKLPGRRLPSRFAQQPLQQSGEFGQARVLVHVGAADRHAVALLHLANPLHADDRIEAQLRERPPDIELLDPDEQGAGKAAAQLGQQRCLRGGLPRRSRCRGRCRCRREPLGRSRDERRRRCGRRRG